MAVKGKVLEKQRAATKTLDKILEGRNTLKTMFSKKGRDEEADIMEKEITNVSKWLGCVLNLYSIEKKLTC